MKKLMKNLLLSALLLCACFALIGCRTENGNPDPVIIEVQSARENQTLFQYMDEHNIAYEQSNGMIVSINGVENTTSCYWMLYTSDGENGNTAWGVYDYNGEALGSSALGGGELIVKSGCVYVWAYQAI